MSLNEPEDFDELRGDDRIVARHPRQDTWYASDLYSHAEYEAEKAKAEYAEAKEKYAEQKRLSDMQRKAFHEEMKNLSQGVRKPAFTSRGQVTEDEVAHPDPEHETQYSRWLKEREEEIQKARARERLDQEQYKAWLASEKAKRDRDVRIAKQLKLIHDSRQRATDFIAQLDKAWELKQHKAFQDLLIWLGNMDATEYRRILLCLKFTDTELLAQLETEDVGVQHDAHH